MRYVNPAETNLIRVNPTINEIIDELRWIIPVDAANFGKQEPPARYKQTGRLVFADGTVWNPGSGAGYYRYNGAAWVLVG